MFGYSAEGEIKLSPSKYFNQRLLNYKQSFASNSDYILLRNQFYKKRILEIRFQLLWKRRWVILQQECLKTISILLKNLLTKIKAFCFMNQIREYSPLEKVSVGSSCDDKTIRMSNFLFSFILWRLEMVRNNRNYFKIE